MRAVLALAALVGFCACAAPSGRPDPFDSQRLVIVMGGMRMQEGRPTVSVALKNKTPDELWVAASFEAPAGGRDCAFFEPIGPGASYAFGCPQDELVFDRVYQVHFEVFADEQRSQPLEQQTTELLFGSEFRDLLEAARRLREE